MKINFKVTRKHIAKGKVKDTHFCPIGLSIKSTGCTAVSVDDLRISFSTPKGTRVSVYPPKKARDFINRFDDSLPVKPMTLTLFI